MNLVCDPWIPVTVRGGGRETISLVDLFQRTDDVVDLAVGALERVSITRLLVAIAQATISGPASTQDWLMRRENYTDGIGEYLNQWHHGFELFGNSQRFLQTPDTGADMTRATDGLSYLRAAGNNTTWRDHESQHGPRKNDPAWLALQLLIYQNYARGGLIASVNLNGRQRPRTAVAAPMSEGNALATLIIGHNLLETIWLNMVSVDRLGSMPLGRPVWESMPETVDAEMAISGSYLGRLVPLSRAIRLHEDGIHMAVGEWIRYALPASRDPFATVVRNTGKDKKTKPVDYLRTFANVDGWRRLPAVLSMNPVAEGMPGGALNLVNLGHLNTSEKQAVVWAGGLDANKARTDAICQWVLTVTPAMMDSVGFMAYSAAVEMVETAAKRLANAVSKYQPGPLAAISRDRFWGVMAQYAGMLETIAATGDVDPWGKVVTTTSRDVFDGLCRPTGGHAWESWAKARRGLYQIGTQSNHTA